MPKIECKLQLVIAAGLALAVACALAPRPCLAGTALVVYSDGRPSERIDLLDRDGKQFIAVSQVARLLGLEEASDPKAGRVILSKDFHSIEVPAGATVWLADSVAVRPSDPALSEGDEIYVSLGDADETIAQRFGKSLRWDQARSTLMAGLPAPNIIDLEVRAEPERVIATIKTIGVLAYDLVPAADNKFELLIRGASFSKKIGFLAEGGLVERVEARQEPQGTRIEVTLGSMGPSYRVFPEWNPDGIVIKVWMPVATEIPEPEFKPPKKIAWQERFTEEQAKLDLIVVDAGHGGQNRGSVGATGYLEKDFNLALARLLKQGLEGRDIEVILTRDDDILVPLEMRTEVANSVGADLFISIHANGFPSKDAKGFEVYFLSPAADEEARYVAAAENDVIETAPVVSGPASEVAFILWDTAQNEFVAESSYLAQLIDQELAKVTGIPNRGVKQADFFVLKGAYLPGILIECAFITNPQEEAMLKDDAFRARIVDAVLTAIARFREDYNR